MPYRLASSTGNLSSATLWETVTNVPTLHASTNLTINNSGTASFTATYTAPNTTNAATGVLLYVNARGTAGTLTVTLQDNSVDTAATASIAVTSLTAGTWLYLRYGTPYTFASTSAGRYRVKVTITGGSGTTSLAADSGGTTVAAFQIDSRTGALATTDDLLIAAPGGSPAITVTADTDTTFGSGANTSAITSQRYLGAALTIGVGGELSWSASASATLTIKGCVNVGPGGTFAMGTVVTPIPTAYTARVVFDPTATGDFGFYSANGSVVSLQGASRSYWKTTLASGVGTAASPLVTVDPVDWDVGDEIIISPTSSSATNYNETERRFIITKNSSTSYVLSSTSGGSETAFSFTHSTSAFVLLITRNVVVETTNAARAWYWNNANTTTRSNFVFSWARVNTCSDTATNKTDARLPIGVSEYSVSFGPIIRGFNCSGSPDTYTGLIVTATWHNIRSEQHIYTLSCARLWRGNLGQCWDSY